MLEVRSLAKTFATGDGRVGAIRDVTFRVDQGAFFTLLGPSGCGKSTTLRAIAGLERPDAGEILIDGKLVESVRDNVHVPPYGRPIGMVFQSYAIWPHLTVFENVAYPLRVRSPQPDASRLDERVMEALRLVKMDGMARRPTPQLSGGQQQRVALARAVVAGPRLLLLDEPLSNLDARLRDDMRRELSGLVSSLGMTTLFVTHDQAEALAMSDRVAVMDQGSIVQEGTPTEVYRSPRCRFVADFLGAANVLATSVSRVAADGQIEVAVQGSRLICQSSDRVSEDVMLTIVIRPEDIAIGLSRPDRAANVFEVTVEHVTFLGALIECHVSSAIGVLLVRAHPSLQLRKGDRAFAKIPPEACQILAR